MWKFKVHLKMYNYKIPQNYQNCLYVIQHTKMKRMCCHLLFGRKILKKALSADGKKTITGILVRLWKNLLNHKWTTKFCALGWIFRGHSLFQPFNILISLQPFTKNLSLTVVFMINSALQEIFNFRLSTVFS